MTVWRRCFASAGVSYPLPTHGALEWQPGGDAVTVPLPPVGAGHLVAASFASRGTSAPFSFRLRTGSEDEKWWHHFETARFGRRTRRRERQRGAGLAVPVDCFETTAPLPAPRLTLVCSAPPPADYLLVVSVRPMKMPLPPSPSGPRPAVAATSLSQTSLPPPLSSSACGPTATAMALGVDSTQGLAAFAAMARHSPSALYGAWPQNLWAAGRHDRLGGLELAADWSLAEQALAAGSPVVASIRFGPGGLAGAPLAATGGHLVLLRGIGDGTVVVNDPAAPPEDVERRYSAEQFAAAWLRWRGAAYVFAAA